VDGSKLASIDSAVILCDDVVCECDSVLKIKCEAICEARVSRRHCLSAIVRARVTAFGSRGVGSQLRLHIVRECESGRGQRNHTSRYTVL